MSETRVVRTCMGRTREGRPCRRWAMRGAPGCDLHPNAPVPCVGGPWDGDEAYSGDGERVAWTWHLFATPSPLCFQASMAAIEDLAGEPVVGTYHLTRHGDDFAYVWQRASEGGPPPAAPDGR